MLILKLTTSRCRFGALHHKNQRHSPLTCGGETIEALSFWCLERFPVPQESKCSTGSGYNKWCYQQLWHTKPTPIASEIPARSWVLYDDISVGRVNSYRGISSFGTSKTRCYHRDNWNLENECQYPTGLESHKWWYQQFRYFKNMLLPVRYQHTPSE